MNTIQRGRPSFHIFRVLKIKVAKRLTGNKITSVPPKAEYLSCYKTVIPRGWHINILGKGRQIKHTSLYPPAPYHYDTPSTPTLTVSQWQRKLDLLLEMLYSSKR